MLILLLMLTLITSLFGQGVQFELEGQAGLHSKNIFHDDQAVYFTFTSDSQLVYHAYIGKWDKLSEKVEWSKKLTIERDVSIHPVKIIGRQDGTFILGAYDYSWIDGFMNGNYTFIHFDKNGQILNTKRLGSAQGGILHDITADGNDVVFLGDRINLESEYRTILGRLDSALNIVQIRSIAKDFYTYETALAKDRNGSFYTAGFTNTAFGLSRAILTRWSANLVHENTVMQLDDDPNTRFNLLHIDDKNQVHVGGNLGNLATYHHFTENLDFVYGHEFNSGYPRNIWLDSDEYVHMLIDGPDYIVRFDDNKAISFDAQYYNVGTITGHHYLPSNEQMVSWSSYHNAENPKSRLVLNLHKYALDKTCFLGTRSGDFNGPIRINSFGTTPVIVNSEVMSEIIPEDLIIEPYTLDVMETCRAGDPTGIDITKSGHIKTFPNPVSERIFLETDINPEQYSGEIIHISGKKSPIPIDELNNREIQISSLPQGLYTLCLRSSNGAIVLSKFIKI